MIILGTGGARVTAGDVFLFESEVARERTPERTVAGVFTHVRTHALTHSRRHAFRR